jgi:hypothetical protein
MQFLFLRKVLTSRLYSRWVWLMSGNCPSLCSRRRISSAVLSSGWGRIAKLRGTLRAPSTGRWLQGKGMRESETPEKEAFA